MADGAPLHGVRRANADDAHRLERVMREVHGDGYWSMFGMTAAEVVSHEDHRVYLATAENRVVGCLIASEREYTTLHSLSVVPAHRGRNHAATMIRAAIAEAGPEWALSGMVATVSEHDRAGRERFLRLGFKQLPHYVNRGVIALSLHMPGRMPRSVIAGAAEVPERAASSG